MGNVQSEQQARHNQEVNRNRPNNTNQPNERVSSLPTWASVAVGVTAAAGALYLVGKAMSEESQEDEHEHASVEGSRRQDSFSDDDESIDESPSEKAARDNRANQCNPNHKPTGPGRPAGYHGDGSKQDLDNHARQLNPEHEEYWKCREVDKPSK